MNINNRQWALFVRIRCAKYGENNITALNLADEEGLIFFFYLSGINGTVKAVAAPRQGVAGRLPCQKCIRPACRPGSQSTINKIIYQVQNNGFMAYRITVNLQI